MRVTVLAGGTGAAKFIRGLVRVIPPRDVTVIVNTGDDLEWWGLHVSPDIDTIVYALLDLLDTERGWGRSGETFHCRDAMAALGAPVWFSLGDKDLATHLHRTVQLRQGKSLSEITAAIAPQVIPMTNDPVRTLVAMDDGEVPFQEFFVHRRHTGAVRGVRFESAETARPAPGVLQSIASAEVVVIAPSNPITSVGPILAVPGIADALASTSARVAAISPIIGTAAFSGPAARLMAMRGLPSTAAGVALAYRPFLDVLLADESDRHLEPEIRQANARPHFTQILMRDTDAAETLARETLDAEPL